MTEEFKLFLNLSDTERVEYLTGYHLKWYQRIQIKFYCRWWGMMRRTNSSLRATDLWESMSKGRF